MAQYILENKTFTAISEPSGMLVNISNVPVEVSLSEEFGTGIILFPRQQLPFSKAVYAARAPGSFGRAIIAAINTGMSTSSSDESIETAEHFTDDDIDFIFDNTTTNLTGFTQEDVAAVFIDSPSIFSSKDIDDVFDDNSSGFADPDVDYVFDNSSTSYSGFTQEDIDAVFAG